MIVTEVSDLRVIDQVLWDAGKARQATLERHGVDREPAPFWSKQRPRYLFSGLMRCGVCGGGFSKVSADHFGCSTARNKGPTACTNTHAIRRDRLEATVLDGLRKRLMDPVLFKEFAIAFTAEWNRAQADRSAADAARQAELQKVRHHIERLVDAIADGTPAAAVNGRLAALEQKRLALEAEVKDAVAPAPRLHPNLAEVYRTKVTALVESLAREDGAEAGELVRSLIDRITLHPVADGQRVKIRGELAAILALSAGAKGVGTAADAETMAVQIKLVAGIGFEPMTFRL